MHHRKSLSCIHIKLVDELYPTSIDLGQILPAENRSNLATEALRNITRRQTQRVLREASESRTHEYYFGSQEGYLSMLLFYITKLRNEIDNLVTSLTIIMKTGEPSFLDPIMSSLTKIRSLCLSYTKDFLCKALSCKFLDEFNKEWGSLVTMLLVRDEKENMGTTLMKE